MASPQQGSRRTARSPVPHGRRLDAEIQRGRPGVRTVLVRPLSKCVVEQPVRTAHKDIKVCTIGVWPRPHLRGDASLIEEESATGVEGVEQFR